MLGLKPKLACSFCGRSAAQVGRLLAGGSGGQICDTCVGHCTRMLGATPSDFASWDSVADADLLALLPVTEAAVEGTRSILQAQIEELRRREVSWGAIGAALNITRQAAWERFS